MDVSLVWRVLSGDPAVGWEENQTLVGGVLFFLCPLLQIPSYCISCPMQEKSVPFFTARCMNCCFYREILICGDCAVAAPFKMPSNKAFGKAVSFQKTIPAQLRRRLNRKCRYQHHGAQQDTYRAPQIRNTVFRVTFMVCPIFSFQSPSYLFFHTVAATGF